MYPSSEAEKPNYPIESVDNALRLLLMLEKQSRLRVSEASEALGVAHSTAHRLLAMLLYRGFVRQDEQSKEYGAGPSLLRVGLGALRNLDVRTISRPHIKSLADETGETVHLATLAGSEVLFLDAVESRFAVRVSARIGESLPAHCTSVGKALLAVLPDERIEVLYSGATIPKVTSRTISSPHKLMLELKAVRERGYAINLEEAEDEVCSVGVAIVDRGDMALGGLSIALPASRWHKSSVEELAAATLDRAAAISAEMDRD